MTPEVQALLGNASGLFRAGFVAETIAAYEKLLAREPNLPDSWFNLAISQRRARQPEAALASYQRALDLGISGPEEVHLQRGVIFSDDLGRSDAARAELEAALAIDPDYVPALLNLGNLHEDYGEREPAHQAYEHALALEPELPLALARLAGLATIKGSDDALLGRLRDALSRPDANLVDRADLGFALGAALDRVGDYDAAFGAYQVANRASREFAANAGLRYDREAQARLVDRLIEVFPAKVDRPVGEAGAQSPIFICGMFRSGSTLTEQILARHSRVVAGGELGALPTLVLEHLVPYPESVASVSGEELAMLRDEYLAKVGGRHPAGTVLTDKRPDNFLHIGLIKTLMPDARIVHTTRATLDNCLSVYFLHAAPELAYATALEDIVHYDREHQRLMDHWRAAYPGDIFELDYDRLVADPAATVDALVAFCGLEAEPGMLDRPATPQVVRTASNWQVRQPLYRGSSGRAQHYSRHFAIGATPS
ncbi:sulfotransferase [Sphingosinicellaceae bacterium]|nr:sulfotransferase [Sphingosinicellaceae bacterium]